MLNARGDHDWSFVEKTSVEERVNFEVCSYLADGPPPRNRA